MRRENCCKPYQPFQTSAQRSQAGARTTRTVNSHFPRIEAETTKGAANTKEYTRTALKIDSRSLRQRNQKAVLAREKIPYMTQGKLMRSLTRRETAQGPREDRQPRPPRNISRKMDQASSENREMARRDQPFTERKKNSNGFVRASNNFGEADCALTKNSIREIQDASRVALTLPEQQSLANYLPPLTISSIDTHNGSTYSRLLALAERRQFDLDAKVRLNWKRLLTRGAFHPNEAREIPTAGEVALQRSKTWEQVAVPRGDRMGKLTGVRFGLGKAPGTCASGRTPFYARYTPQEVITVISQSPLTSTHHFYSTDRRVTNSRPQTYWPKSDPTPPPVRWSYATCACLAPPVTPSSPMFRASPTRQRGSQSAIGRQSALEDIEETESCLGEMDKDEGIGTPSTEDSIDGLSYTGLQ